MRLLSFAAANSGIVSPVTAKLDLEFMDPTVILEDRTQRTFEQR
jgi:hypothetical protein